MAVAPVIQEAYAIIALRQINKPVGRCFESRLIPAGIAVGRALDYSILHLIGGLTSAQIKRESYLEQDMMVMPVDMGHKIDAGFAAVDRDMLVQRAGE